MSLRWRIALAVAAVASLTTLAVGVASYRSTHARLYPEVDNSLEIEASRPFQFPDFMHVGEDGRIEITAGERDRFPTARPLVEQQVVARNGQAPAVSRRRSSTCWWPTPRPGSPPPCSPAASPRRSPTSGSSR